MKKILLGLMLVSSATMADTVRLSDGNSCSFDADDTPWSLSFEAKRVDKDDNGYYGTNKRFYNQDENHVGAKLTYSFGGPERLDCAKLYNIQLNTKNAELKLLEQKLQILQSNASINWD